MLKEQINPHKLIKTLDGAEKGRQKASSYVSFNIASQGHANVVGEETVAPEIKSKDYEKLKK